MICKGKFVGNTFKKPVIICLHTVKSFNYCYPNLIVIFEYR